MTKPIDLEPALETCPFCSGCAEVYESDTIQGNFDVICTSADCGGMAVGSSKAAAIAAWNRRAARSAPEAEKAVDALANARDAMSRAADILDGHLLPHEAGLLRRAADGCRAALASVPAPSGAEAVGWQWKTLDTWHTIDKSSVADPEAYARAQASGGQYRPIYAAPQAVPAEDVGPIEDALHSCVCLLETLAESAKERDDHTEWAMMSVMAENCRATLTASEAEATSLRRKLKKAERIGKMMANAIYNVHQRGLHVNADDMDSLKECQEAWDRALTTDGGANG